MVWRRVLGGSTRRVGDRWWDERLCRRGLDGRTLPYFGVTCVFPLFALFYRSFRSFTALSALCALLPLFPLFALFYHSLRSFTALSALCALLPLFALFYRSFRSFKFLADNDVVGGGYRLDCG